MDFTLVYSLLLSFGSFLFWNVDGHSRARRVINGTEAVPHSSPWMAQFLRSDGALCGCFLISRNMVAKSDAEDHSSDIVLTSAHCFLDDQQKYLAGSILNAKVIFGKHRNLEEERADFSLNVVNVYIHPKFKNETLNITDMSYDIAVLQLSHSVAYDNYTMPISLQTKQQNAYKDCYLAGWGDSGEEQMAEALNVIRYEEVTYNSEKRILEASTKLQSPYVGDSGSTLVCQLEDRPFAVGLLYGRYDTTLESIFLSIPLHWNWIKMVVGMTQKAVAYRSNLMNNVENLSMDGRDWLLAEHYLRKVYEIVPNTLPFALNLHAKTEIVVNDAMIDQMHKYLNIQNGFCLGEIISSFEVANAEECAIRCDRENHHGFCNYFAIMNNCFFINQPIDWLTTVVETPSALCMRFRDTPSPYERTSSFYLGGF